MKKTVILNNIAIEYELTKKNVKNLNLRIKRDGTVFVSCPVFMSDKIVDDFIVSKSDFILRAIENAVPQCDTFYSGSIVYYLGKATRLHIVSSNENKVSFDGNSINVSVKNDNIEYAKKVYYKWQKNMCEELILSLCSDFYNKNSSFTNSFPIIKLRRMKSRWGSCQPKKNILTFNTRLIEMPISACEYVVAHEFAHFIHADHSKNFYGLLDKLMPDWKERRKQLRFK